MKPDEYMYCPMEFSLIAKSGSVKAFMLPIRSLSKGQSLDTMKMADQKT